MPVSALVRSATRADLDAWVRMRRALWPDPNDDHPREAQQFFDGRLRNLLEVLLAFDASGRAVGFAELSIRNCAEGCVTDRIGYLEGWYVEPEVRRQGVGRARSRRPKHGPAGRGALNLARTPTSTIS